MIQETSPMIKQFLINKCYFYYVIAPKPFTKAFGKNYMNIL